MLTGCTRCLPRAGERPSSDEEADVAAEGDPRLALSDEVQEDEDLLCYDTEAHSLFPSEKKIRSGALML